MGVRVPPSAPRQREVFMTTPTVEEAAITLVKDEALSKKYKITLAGADILEHVQPFITAKAKTAKMPGFRPGKVPVEKVFAQYGGEALEYAIERCVNREVQKLLKENPWSLVTRPHYEMLSFPSVSSLQHIASSSIDVSVEFTLNPTIQECDTTQFSVPHYSVVLSPAYIQKGLEDAASTSLTSEPLESPREARKGDTIVYFLEYFDEKGIIKSMEGMFQLGSDLFPSEFQESFVGASVGHTVEERIRVPKNFPDKDLAGRKVTFKLLFSEIRHTVPHKVDDAFAKTYGCSDVEELRQHFTEKFTKKSHNDAQEVSRRMLQEQLDASLSFEVPEILVQERSMHIWEMVLSALKKSQNLEPTVGWNKLSEKMKKRFHDYAEASVRRRLFLRALAEEKGVNVTQNDTMAALDALAKDRQVSMDQLANYFQKNKRELQEFHESVQEAKAEEFILAHCARPEESISVEDMEKKHKDLMEKTGIALEDVLKDLTAAKASAVTEKAAAPSPETSVAL